MFSTRISSFNIVCHKVKNKFNFQPYKWQVIIILDILNGFNVAVYISINLEKSLPFQTIPKVKIGAIIFIISLIMALMKDQVDESLILLLSYPISDDILVLHNTKKGLTLLY